MRTVLFALACLICSTGIAKEHEHTRTDWRFGCHILTTDTPIGDRPCWVQSATVAIQTKDHRKAGTFVFQVHFFEQQKVLRVFIEPASVFHLHLVFQDKHGELFVLEEEVKLANCTVHGCFVEYTIDDKIIEVMATSTSMTMIFWKHNPPSREGEVWTARNALTMSNFAESVAKLRRWQELTDDPNDD